MQASVTSSGTTSEFCAIVALDIEAYGDIRESHAASTLDALKTIVDRCMKAAELPSPEETRKAEFTGDEIAVAFAHDQLFKLFNAFPRELNEALLRYDREKSTASPTLRVRVAIHVGILRAEYRGQAFTHLKRLLSSEVLHEALATSDPERSKCAVIVSDLAHEIVVEGGFYENPDKDFVRVTENQRNKRNYRARGWIHVPGLHGLPRLPSQLRARRRKLVRGGGALVTAATLIVVAFLAGNDVDAEGTPSGVRAGAEPGTTRAADYLRVESPVEDGALPGQTLDVGGALLRPLPSGTTIWVATRKVNAVDSPAATGADTGVDNRGPCEVDGVRWLCAGVNIGDEAEPGEFAVYVLLADASTARDLVRIIRDQLTTKNYRHRLPASVKSLPPIHLRRADAR